MTRIITLSLLLLLSLPALAAVSFIGSCTGTSSCTTTNNTGDLELAYAGRDLSATAPSLATGWTTVTTVSINGTGTADSSTRMACKVTTGTNEASNTFTNAGTLTILVFRGQGAGSTATCATDLVGTSSDFKSAINTAPTTETFNTLTTVASSSSWVVGFGYCSACTAGINTAPSGMTNHASVTGPPGIGAHSTNATSAGFTTANVTLTTGGRIITSVVEIKGPLTSNSQTQFGGASAVFPISVTAGDSIACYAVALSATSALACSDDQVNTYTVPGACPNPVTFGTGRSTVQYAKAASTGLLTVTVTNSTVSTLMAFAAVSTGRDPTTAFDGCNHNEQTGVANSTDAITSGALTTTVNGDDVFGFSCDTGSTFTVTGGTGFTVLQNQDICKMEYQAQTSAGSITATFTPSTTGQNTTTNILAFKQTAGTATPAKRIITVF